MLKSLFNSAVDKYKKTQMTLVDIDNDPTKIEVIQLLMLTVGIDGDIDEQELWQLISFMQETLLPHSSENEINEVITRFKDSFNSGQNTNAYVNQFKQICLSLSDKLNNKQKTELLGILITFIQSDGVIDSNERALLQLFRENIQYNGVFGKSHKIDDDCPGCRGGNTSRAGSEELDRWVKPKEVREKMANGNIKTRHVQTTYIKERIFYNCLDCAQAYSSTISREK
jgi:uncharacterized tellurite resistance protein B-like protein